jgi:hypothetical protein
MKKASKKVRMREKVSKELLIKQAKALKDAKGDAERAAEIMGISYGGFLNRFRVGGLNFHKVRSDILDGVAVEKAVSNARIPDDAKVSPLETAIRLLVREEYRRLTVAA